MMVSHRTRSRFLALCCCVYYNFWNMFIAAAVVGLASANVVHSPNYSISTTFCAISVFLVDFKHYSLSFSFFVPFLCAFFFCSSTCNSHNKHESSFVCSQKNYCCCWCSNAFSSNESILGKVVLFLSFVFCCCCLSHQRNGMEWINILLLLYDFL